MQAGAIVARTTFTPNPSGLAQILRGAPAKAFLTHVASVGAASVRAAHPVVSGFNVARIGVGQTADGDPAVITTSPFWHLVEYGSVNNGPYRPFTRGMQSIRGLKYTPFGRGG